MKITEEKVYHAKKVKEDFSEWCAEGLDPGGFYRIVKPDIYWEYLLYIDSKVVAWLEVDDRVVCENDTDFARIKALEFFKDKLSKGKDGVI